jgi:hypothetical protein
MPNHQTICTILADLWINHREQGDFKMFCEYNDVGLPLAYFLSEGLVTEITEDGQNYVIETFDLLLAALNLKLEEINDDMSLSDLFKMMEDRQ